MKKSTFSLMIALVASLSLSAQTTWVFDQTHTSVGFSVDHLVICETTGQFGSFEGTATSPSDDFERAAVEFSIDIASIDTDNERRDGQLKSDDFFNAEKYPKMTFKRASLEKVDGNTYKRIGDLTIRDVTKPIELEVEYKGTAQME